MLDDVGSIITDLPPLLSQGRIGFFWIVDDAKGNDVVLLDSIALAKAELYGTVLTHPGGHYDFWEEMKSNGGAGIRSRKLSLKLLRSEYEEWPRGRVVFHTDTQRFNLMADSRLHTPERLALLRAAFSLPMDFTDTKRDGHYSQPAVSLIEKW